MIAGCRKPRGKRKGQAKSPAAGSSEKKLVRTPSKRIGVLTDEELAARSPCCNVPYRITAISSVYTIDRHMDMSYVKRCAVRTPMLLTQGHGSSCS